MLVKLKGIFEVVTRKKANVTWNEHDECYAGKFFAFVEPILATLDEARGKRVRSNMALGSLLLRVTRKPDSEVKGRRGRKRYNLV
jgi:hypothetical protein